MQQRPIVPFLVLAGGILIASTAAIMIRLAQEEGAPSLTIAAGRLVVAALLLTPLAWRRAGLELRQLQRRDLWLAVGSGAFLAIHFAAWISSLAYTSVASSVALVTTNPLWVGLASYFFFRERLGVGGVVGILLTFAGTAFIIISDSQLDAALSAPNPTLGNGLALLGAIGVSGYFLIGRDLRRRLSLLAYIWVVYSVAALFLVAALLLLNQPFLGFSPLVYALIVGLAVGPQLVGHTSFNWALRYLSATFIAVAILGEPIGSAVLALFIFGEGFAPLQLAGFVLLLVGIYVVAANERRRRMIKQKP